MRLPTRFLLIPILLLAAQVAPAADAEHADLSGEWVLNKAASDDPATVMRQAMSRSGSRSGDIGGRGGSMGGGGRRGGGMAGGRGGVGRGGGGMAGGERPDADGTAGGPGARMLERFQTLSIFHEADEIDITDGMDISRLLHVDGKGEKVWTERGQVTATADWYDDVLVILWQGGGSERTSRYALSADGTQLVLTEEIDLPRGGDKVKLRMVYDRAAGNPEDASK